MEVPTPSPWLSDLEMEDLMLFQEPYEAKSLLDELIMFQNMENEHISSLDMNHNKHHRHLSLSSSIESNSDIPMQPTATTTTTLRSPTKKNPGSTTDTTTTTTKSKPTKKPKRDQNSTSKTPFPVVLNFGSTLLPTENDENHDDATVEDGQEGDEECLYVNHDNDDVLNELPRSKRKYIRRASPTSSMEHIMAERRRREKLSQNFAALSALIPGLSRMDKTSILSEAIKLLKQLQDKIKDLEQNTAKRSVESVMLVKKAQLAVEEDDHSSCTSCNEYFHSTLSQAPEQSPEIEAKLSNKSIMIKITCEKRATVLVRILSAIEQHNLSVTTVQAAPFGGNALNVTIIAEMEKQFDIRLQNILQDLSLACKKSRQ